MELIECCITSHDYDGGERPREMHTLFSRPNSPQNKQTQYEILSDVTGLADEMVNKEQSLLRRVREKPSQDRNDYPAGVIRGKHAGRER
jgi:hypothetical protein